jgi:ABC-2 type transport system permease protein
MRLGRFSQGLAVFIWSIAALHLVLTPARIIMVLFAILGGVCLFYGLFILQATLSFWTVDALEIMNILTYGGTEAGEYPLPIYSRWFQKLFIFVVPLAGVVYFPSLVILGKTDTILHSPAWLHWLAPLFPVIFLLISLRVWEFGVRHYRSVGS